MAVLRDHIVNENAVNYVASLAFFCGISCTILMLRFGGFKANFDLITGKRVKVDYYDDIPTISNTTGAYRSSRDDYYYRNVSTSDTPKKVLVPSMVKLPPSSQPNQSKSTDNLSQAVNKWAVIPGDVAKSTPNISANPKTQTNPPNNIKLGSNQENAVNASPNLAKSTPNVSSIHNVPQDRQNNVQRDIKPVSNQNNADLAPPNLSKSTPNVSVHPSGESATRPPETVPKPGPLQNQRNTQPLDKKALAAQKKAEKLAAQEQAKQEKLRKQQEAKQEKERKQLESKQAKERKKQEAEQEKQRKQEEKARKQMEAKQEKERKAREKLAAQQAKKNQGKPNNNPLAQSRANPTAQSSQQLNSNPVPIPAPPPLPATSQPKSVQPLNKTTNPMQNTSQGTRSSTNTLESSISRTSGPPPYSEINQKVQNKNDNSGNTSFGKPVQEASTWDMVSQHRQELSRPPVSGGRKKQAVLDLQYGGTGDTQAPRKSVLI